MKSSAWLRPCLLAHIDSIAHMRAASLGTSSGSCSQYTGSGGPRFTRNGRGFAGKWSIGR